MILIRQGYRVLALSLLLAIVNGLSACNSAAASQPLATVQATNPQPTVQVDLNGAQQIAGDFLNAWAADQYNIMYSLLAVNSRDAYAYADFKSDYADAEDTMALLPSGKSFTLTNAIQQSDGAQIAYDMTFKTRVFGPFTDAGRTLQLVSTPQGWRVAWTPGDVFAEMKDGAVLDLTQSTPTRANIYDRDGQVIADEQGEARTVTLLTKSYPTGNPDDCFRELSRVFNTRAADEMKSIYGGIHTGHDYAFEIGTLNMDVFQAERPTLEKVCTLQYAIKPMRRYVAGNFAAHVIGHIGPIPKEQLDEWTAKGYPVDALVGVDGIEYSHEADLAGKGEATLSLTLQGDAVRVLAHRDAQPSQSVYLTLDPKLQTAVQDTLKDAYSQAAWGANSTGAAAIIMDIHNGQILAMASYPDFNVEAFNPNTSLKDAQTMVEGWLKDPRKPTFNRATLGQYPAGSIFKIVSMAAAADSGVFSLSTPYVCTGIWDGKPLGDRLRKDWIASMYPYQHGRINLEQALTGSCDTYFWNVGWTLNRKNPQILVNYAKQMGLGASTGITDIADAAGNLPDPANYEQTNGIQWRGSDALNLVIGQGDVLVTPLQIVRMVAAVANGGTLYQPMLVQKIGLIGETKPVDPVVNGHLNIKPDILKGMQTAMCAVTTDQILGTATFVFQGLKGAAVCGKTGTAQAGGIYDLPHAWFTAYAGKTADSPDIAIVVVVEHSSEGSYIAAPIVRRLVESYYGLDITPWPPSFLGYGPQLGTGD